MRERATRVGFSAFADHELLEVLLYHSVPRVDTNPIAHVLLKEFGSLKGVMDASVDELCRVSGVGERSAQLLKLTIEMMRRYEADCLKKVRAFSEIGEVIDYLHPKFCGMGVECLYVMLFNNRMNLIECVKLSEGSVNSTDASIRKITELALNRKCASVLLAHNHPNGVAVPSSFDLHLTEMLNTHLDTLGIVLLEHLIFAGMSCQPIMRKQFGTFRCSPVSQKLERDFYEKFYGKTETEYKVAPCFNDPIQE